jgi:hypothetical protein
VLLLAMLALFGILLVIMALVTCAASPQLRHIRKRSPLMLSHCWEFWRGFDDVACVIIAPTFAV